MEAEERPAKVRKLSHDGCGDGEPSSSFAKPEASLHDEPCGEPGTARNESEISHPDGNAKDSNLESKPSGEYEDEHANDDFECKDESEDLLPAPEANAPLAGHENGASEDPPTSKNQMKKLRKKQEWEAGREERKVIRKEKIAAKRERKREAKTQAAEGDDSQKQINAAPLKETRRRRVQLPITILIDCDFDDLMRDNERISLAGQITRSYSDNKNNPFQAHLAMCSFGGKLKDRFDNILSHHKLWRGVRFLDCDFVDAAEKAKEWMVDSQGGKLAATFAPLAGLDEAAQAKLKDQGELIYLSSEADETLTELKPYSTYIIGGLVDKNREKGICYKRATKRGVRTARLPIGEFMDMQSRKVLATNHVNEIMLNWLECGDWGEAFVKVIPKRKGGTLKGTSDVPEQDAPEEAEDEDRSDVSGGGVAIPTDTSGNAESVLHA